MSEDSGTYRGVEFKLDNDQKNRKPISIEEIKKIAQGELINIPSWEEGKTITVRVKRVDMTKELLNENGAMTNILKPEVIKQFDEDGKKINDNGMMTEDDRKLMKDIKPLLDQISKESLLEPTYEQIEEIYPLTFKQKYSLLNYQMEGLRGLKSFRE